MRYSLDSKFVAHFKNIKQVFLYVINDCNLACPQCIYKPNIYFNIGEKEMPFETAVDLMETFHSIGASKLTILGGEPTLYGKGSEKKLGDLIQQSKMIGYSYVRIDTNGIFDDDYLNEDKIKMLDEISFSVDGYDKKTNDGIRGDGSFVKTMNNVLSAVVLGYNVNITSCIYDELLDYSDGEYEFEKIIYLAEKLGVKRINFHALIKDGTPIDLWSGDLQIKAERWIDCYKTIRNNIENRKYKIEVRIPQAFITREEFDDNVEYYGFCPAKLGERVLVHPDGIIRMCSGLLGTAYSIADYYDKKIVWNERLTNELRVHKCDLMTPCTNRSKKDFGPYVPLCFSFKPRQSEYVYKNLLGWDKKEHNNSVTTGIIDAGLAVKS